MRLAPLHFDVSFRPRRQHVFVDVLHLSGTTGLETFFVPDDSSIVGVVTCSEQVLNLQ